MERRLYLFYFDQKNILLGKKETILHWNIMKNCLCQDKKSICLIYKLMKTRLKAIFEFDMGNIGLYKLTPKPPHVLRRGVSPMDYISVATLY